MYIPKEVSFIYIKKKPTKLFKYTGNITYNQSDSYIYIYINKYEKEYTKVKK